MSERIEYHMTHLDAHGVREYMGVLDQRHYDSELDVNDLHEAISALYEVNGEIRSVGIEFLLYRLGILKEMVSPAERVAFFREHLPNPAISKVITSSQLFDTLSGDEVDELVRTITERHAMPDCTWIRTVSGPGRGVSRQTVLEAVMAQLDESKFTLDESRPFAESFLRHGAGRVVTSNRYVDHFENPCEILLDTAPIWCQVPDDAFFGVVEACIRRAPEVMFMPPTTGEDSSLQHRLQALRPDPIHAQYMPYTFAQRGPQPMLTLSQVRELQHLAVANLKTLKGLDIEQLMELSFEQHKTIVKACLPGSLEFLVRATLHVDYYEEVDMQEARRSFFHSHIKGLSFDKPEDVLNAYQNVRHFIVQMMWVPEVDRLARRVDGAFRQLLATQGYFVGNISREASKNHGVQTVMHVVYDGKKYTIVQNNRQKRDFCDGDLVYVDLNTDPYIMKRFQSGAKLLFGYFRYLDPSKERSSI